MSPYLQLTDDEYTQVEAYIQVNTVQHIKGSNLEVNGDSIHLYIPLVENSAVKTALFQDQKGRGLSSLCINSCEEHIKLSHLTERLRILGRMCENYALLVYKFHSCKQSKHSSKFFGPLWCLSSHALCFFHHQVPHTPLHPIFVQYQINLFYLAYTNPASPCNSYTERHPLRAQDIFETALKYKAHVTTQTRQTDPSKCSKPGLICIHTHVCVLIYFALIICTTNELQRSILHFFILFHTCNAIRQQHY